MQLHSSPACYCAWPISLSLSLPPLRWRETFAALNGTRARLKANETTERVGVRLIICGDIAGDGERPTDSSDSGIWFRMPANANRSDTRRG